MFWATKDRPSLPKVGAPVIRHRYNPSGFPFTKSIIDLLA